jgi:hypothetical protein
MASEPAIVERPDVLLRLQEQSYRLWSLKREKQSRLLHDESITEIEALRSRVAAQDAEIARLRGLVGSLTDRLLVWKDTSPLLAEARAEVPR